MTVLITGATGGLGRALVAAFAADGHAVAIGYRGDRRSAESLLASIERGIVVGGDLAGPDRDAVAREMVQQVVTALGSIDVLVNNAADQALGDWRAQGAAAVDAMIAATYGSVVAMTRAALPAMTRPSHIVNITSVEAAQPFPGHAHYAAAKAAVTSLSTSMANDLASDGIAVNAVAPGLIDRPELGQEWPDGVSWWSARAPIGRPVTADEVAVAVVQLTKMRGVTGTVLTVDGGWHGALPPIAP